MSTVLPTLTSTNLLGHTRDMQTATACSDCGLRWSL